MCLITIMLMSLSMPLGIPATSTSKLFSSLKIMWPWYPCKLWKIVGSFLGTLTLNYIYYVEHL